MKKIGLILAMIGCVIATLVMSVTPVLAAGTANHCTMWTTDTSDVPKIVFNLGETVRIHWTADGTVDIKSTYQPTSAVDAQWLGQPSSGTVDYVPGSGAGTYVLEANGAPAIAISVATVLVIPEVPLGVMMSTIAFFAALGSMKLRRIKD